ncbi:MAG: hypothetical protein LBR53_12370 [Deltaproteobacteria bacterium]|jgi:hypothetical protein|nr:hypothetical protein [Deltaproteobacteria bacterium]
MNGGVKIITKYADGLGYADIVVEYKTGKYVIEMKLKGNEGSRADSLDQLFHYMDSLLVKEGWLVVVDRKSKKSWGGKITWETLLTPEDKRIHVV